MSPQTKRLTEEQELLLDCWHQWSQSSPTSRARADRRWAGDLGILEDLELYLRANGIIDEQGLSEWDRDVEAIARDSRVNKFTP